MDLKNAFEESIKIHRAELEKILAEKGSKEFSPSTVQHLFRGMRGVPQAYTPTSHVDPQKGVLYRGKTLDEVKAMLPKLPNTEFPTIEAVFWYLLTGMIPSTEQVNMLIKDLHVYSSVPHHVYNAIDALPDKTRPMSRFCSAILALTPMSSFQDLYDKGKLSKNDYWKYAFDDAIRLIANLSQITAYIYKVYCKHEDSIETQPELDWAGNFSSMMGYSSESTQDLFRMFLFTHADHSASNVSAHTAHTVGSALSNVYYTLTASMLGLVGPLHGHANEQTVLWLLKLLREAKTDNESEEDISDDYIRKYIQNTLDSGRVIPGYGHAALRVEDPRFTMFYNRCTEKNSFNTPILKLVKQVYNIAPGILSATGKVSNPNPNIDAISGSCLYSEGIVEHQFYTVLFGMSRLFGILTQHIIDRSIAQPIFRPKTISLDMLKNNF